MSLKRFILFAGEHYYPGGGTRDYVNSFDTLEEAMAFVESIRKKPPEKMGLMGGRVDWADILDKETGEFWSDCDGGTEYTCWDGWEKDSVEDISYEP